MDQPADSSVPVIAVVAAVVRKGEYYLLCQRPADKRHGGLWEFPGGKVIDSETSEAAIERELMEELGVRVTTVYGELGRFQDDGSDFLVQFLRVHIEGEPIAREHQRVGWFTPTEMHQLELAPADRHLVNSLQFGELG